MNEYCGRFICGIYQKTLQIQTMSSVLFIEVCFRTDEHSDVKSINVVTEFGKPKNFLTHRTRLRVSAESRMTKTVCGCRTPASCWSDSTRFCSPVWMWSELTADIAPGTKGVLTSRDPDSAAQRGALSPRSHRRFKVSGVRSQEQTQERGLTKPGPAVVKSSSRGARTGLKFKSASQLQRNRDRSAHWSTDWSAHSPGHRITALRIDTVQLLYKRLLFKSWITLSQTGPYVSQYSTLYSIATQYDVSLFMVKITYFYKSYSENIEVSYLFLCNNVKPFLPVLFLCGSHRLDWS